MKPTSVILCECICKTDTMTDSAVAFSFNQRPVVVFKGGTVQEDGTACWRNTLLCRSAMFCLLLCVQYLNINTKSCCYHKCNGELACDWVSRPVATDSPAAVMIHLHSGKTGPRTSVLPLSSPVLPAPITHPRTVRWDISS